MEKKWTKTAAAVVLAGSLMVTWLCLLGGFAAPEVRAGAARGWDMGRASFPYVTSTDPDANAVGAPANTDVSVTYDQAMDLGTVDDTTFAVYGSYSPLAAGSYSLVNSDRQVVFNPAQGFFPGERVDAIATSAIESTLGFQGESSHLWQFWVAVSGGSATFADSGQALGNTETASAALGDIDGDGDLDAVTADRGSNMVYRNDGAGNFSTIDELGSGNTYGVALGDLDGDGDLDLFGANSSSNHEVWFNDGAGNFDTPFSYVNTASAYAVELGDLDGDGDL
ncbi:MAG: VCBS repeat-containing protein, partial [Anaerolineae bacterium]|nr:VCBS repeat-containing protein [Anaerolineae bacterium]